MILSKSKIYENRIIQIVHLYEKFIDDMPNCNDVVLQTIYRGSKKLICFLKSDRDLMLYSAIYIGQKELIDILLFDKLFYDIEMRAAIEGYHENLVHFFISKGAKWWGCGLIDAVIANNERLVHFFISKGARNFYDALVWAKRKNHKKLINFFQEKIE